MPLTPPNPHTPFIKNINNPKAREGLGTQDNSPPLENAHQNSLPVRECQEYHTLNFYF